MKKSMFLGLSLALVSLVACVRGPEEELKPEANITLTALTESSAPTRTIVVENGEDAARVYWEPGDSFIAFSESKRGFFYSQISESCETADFRGYFENGPWAAGMDLWALYPWDGDANCEDGVFTTVLPSRQVARPGTFAREANLAIAHTTSNTLQFYNVGGGVRFSVQEEGIKEVILQGLDGEYLAGKIQVGFQNDVPAVLDVVEGKHSITLAAPYGQTFLKDTWYYFVAIPGALEKGFALDFFKEDTHGSRVFDKSVTVKRSIYGTVTHADEGVSYTPCADGVIAFKDEKVKSILVSHFDVNGDKRISVREAAIVRSFLVKKAQTRADKGKVSIFAGTDITSFDELVYFTGLTRIEDGAFAGCEQLTSITLPETITSIGDNAFNGCTGLQSIVVLSSTPPAIGTDAFANSGDCPISVPEDVVDQYVSAWNEYADRIRAMEDSACPVPEAVDLGLPSGTKWASFNLGASKPEEYGDYYSWGETKPKSVFDLSTYKWYKKEGGSEGLTKYCMYPIAGFDGFHDDKWLLDPEDDAAHVKLGEDWRMPTAGEWDELARLCAREWVSLGGVTCAKLTGPNGNSIILPPGGGAADGDFQEVGETGVFWSSSGVHFESDEVGAWIFGYYEGMGEDGYEDGAFPYPNRCLLTAPEASRCSGFSIRPVSGPVPVFAESLTLDKTDLNLEIGETATLTATVLPGNTTHKAILWACQDERIANVSSTGEVTGLRVGETVIYALLMDGFMMAQCKIGVGVPEAVDLGLPSGIKWASFNLESSFPYGDYYAWGETSPYYKTGSAQSASPEWREYNNGYSDFYGRSYGDLGGYNWKSYRFCDGHEFEDGDFSFSIVKYTDDRWGGDGKRVLDQEDDAARVLLGGEWRLPSRAEMDELVSECLWEWAEEDGTSGYKVTSKTNSNSIFLPASGIRYGTKFDDINSYGYYWSSSLYPTSDNYAIGLGINSEKTVVGGYARYYGFSLRPVRGNVPVPVESVSFDKSELTLLVGETATLEATVNPGNATFTGLGYSVTYGGGSSGKLSLTRDGDGIIVTGLAPGTATIWAASYDGGKMASCQVTIEDPDEGKMQGLLGMYTFTSSMGAYYNPWTVQLIKDDNDIHKIWFHNLFANPGWAAEDTRFYGIVDDGLNTITIPYGQPTEYKYEETPITLYWLAADNSEGKTGSNTVTLLKDGSGTVVGLDFDENYGFGAVIENVGWVGWAYPHITAEKQNPSASTSGLKKAPTRPSTSPKKAKLLPPREQLRPVKGKPEELPADLLYR